MSEGLADFTLANDLGFIRDEIVASYIDALGIDLSAGQADGSKRNVAILNIQNDVLAPKQRLLTQTLVDCHGSTLLIPAGSIIEEVSVCKVGADALAEDLSFVLGYLCNDLASMEAKKALAGRIASNDQPITGKLLNKHKIVKFCQKLNKEKLGSENALYAADAASQGEPTEASIEYGIVANGVSVGEAKDLYPCSTILEGTVKRDSINIVFVYSAPADQ